MLQIINRRANQRPILKQLLQLLTSSRVHTQRAFTRHIKATQSCALFLVDGNGERDRIRVRTRLAASTWFLPFNPHPDFLRALSLRLIRFVLGFPPIWSEQSGGVFNYDSFLSFCAPVHRCAHLRPRRSPRRRARVLFSSSWRLSEAFYLVFGLGSLLRALPGHLRWKKKCDLVEKLRGIELWSLHCHRGRTWAGWNMYPEKQFKARSYLSSRRFFKQRLRERDDRGWTLLHIGARKGDSKEVGFLESWLTYRTNYNCIYSSSCLQDSYLSNASRGIEISGWYCQIF